MKILLFFPCNGNIGGAERRLVRSFTKIMQEDEHFQFELWLLPVKKINEEHVKQQYKSLTNTNIVFKHGIKRLMQGIIFSDFDCICYTDSSVRCIPVLLSGVIGRKKRLMICVNTIGSSFQLRPRIKQLLYYLDIQLSNRIDCLYPTNTKLLKNKFKKKIITCTACSFTDTNKFIPWDEKKKKIVFLGRLIKEKGIREFVESCVYAQDSIRSNGYVCEIYGDGKEEKNIENIIDGNHCTDIIKVKGHILDSSKILGGSRIFCSLQPYGNYPSQSLLEAMACGNYCIVSNTGDSSLLVDSDFGCLVDMTIESIGEAIIRAVKFDNDMAATIAKASREFILSKYTLDRSAKYYKAIIQETIDN